LRKDHEDHVPIYTNRIQYLEQQLSTLAPTETDKRISVCDEIIATSRLGLDKINQNDLLKYLGEKQHDPSVEENKKCKIFLLKYTSAFFLNSYKYIDET
jgi:hypothetical protein